MDVGRSDGGRGVGGSSWKSTRGRGGWVTGRRGCFVSILSFYIVLAQTLCAHNTLQEQKTNKNKNEKTGSSQSGWRWMSSYRGLGAKLKSSVIHSKFGIIHPQTSKLAYTGFSIKHAGWALLLCWFHVREQILWWELYRFSVRSIKPTSDTSNIQKVAEAAFTPELFGPW